MEEILKLVSEYIKDKKSKKTWTAGKDLVQYAGDYFDDQEYVAAIRSLLGGWLVLGLEGNRFEAKFPKKLGKKLGLLTNSGSSANLLMMAALTYYYQSYTTIRIHSGICRYRIKFIEFRFRSS